MIRSGSSWVKGAGAWITQATDNYFANFLDRAFMVNGVDNNWVYDGSFWQTQGDYLADSPIAHYIRNYSTRLFLYNIKIAGTDYPSRCWFSDYPKNNKLTWGLETASDLTQTAGSGVITSTASAFETRNIKIGDPLFITSGTNAGQYTVQSVDSNTQITLTDTLTYSATNSSFWVGGNWFDVMTDDGDIGMGLGFASDEILLYKKNSVHRYNDKGQTRYVVKNMPGTTSPRSILVASDGYCYSYHPSGIWRTKGSEGDKVSDAIEDVIAGVTTANQDNVIAWETDKEKVKMFLGDVTLRDGDTITKCVAVLNHQTNTWELESLGITPTCATTWLHANVEEVYVGDNADTVYQLNDGYTQDTLAFGFGLTLHPIFPVGSERLVDFTRLRLYVSNGLGVQVMFKLLYKPVGYNEKHWTLDNDWRAMRGSQRGERSEWVFPEGSRASGVQLKIIESSKDESFLVEKMVLYYANASDR